MFELERQQELEALALQRLQAAEITKRRQTLESLMDNRALVLDTIAEEHHRRDTSSLENLDYLLAKAELLERELNSGAYDVQQKVRMAEALSAIAEDSSVDPTVVRYVVVVIVVRCVCVCVSVCLLVVAAATRTRESTKYFVFFSFSTLLSVGENGRCNITLATTCKPCYIVDMKSFDWTMPRPSDISTRVDLRWHKRRLLCNPKNGS